MSAIETDVVVIGAGPGGYSAAFRAADLGLNVTLVERYSTLGGVCLNVGCIPSKAYLHAAEVIENAAEMEAHGIKFGKPTIDVEALRKSKDDVVKKLTGGLAMMAKQRKVNVVQASAKFSGSNELTLDNGDTIQFKNCIIAAGSEPVKLPFIPDDERIIDSTGALELKHTKGDMLVLGGGIIGLEMATVYNALGTTIDVVEMQPQLIPGADADVVKPLADRLKKRYRNIMLKTSVTKVEAKKDGIHVTFEGEGAPAKPVKYDSVLVAVGRKANGNLLDADKAGVKVNERGIIEVDQQMKTNVSHIYAIGDVTGNPMLAHRASAQGRLAAEVISGKKHYFNPKGIPSVAYTDPEIAWFGVTEREAKEQGINYGKGVFPWMASGRAIGVHRTEGSTKLIFDKDTHRIIGGAIVGIHAGEMISEVALAVEMGADVEDIALTVHPHPTLSESVMMAAEMFEGTITDLYVPKKK